MTTCIGLDLGGTKLAGARIERADEGDATIAAWCERPAPRDGSEFAMAVADVIGALGGARDLAVGLAVPGHLDAERRTLVRSTNLPGLVGVDLRAALEPHAARVVVDADTNAGAVAEARAGAGRGAARVLYVSLGTGLGAALVAQGEPVRASHHVVGHIADIPLGPDARRAESALGAAGIAALAPGVVSPRELGRLRDLADAGEPLALGAWRTAGRALGDLLGILAPLWRPDVIVVGGGVAAAGGERLLDPARDRLAQGMSPSLPRVLSAEWGARAGAVGAALAAG